MNSTVLIKVTNISPYIIIKKFNELNVSIINLFQNKNDTYLIISYQNYNKVVKKLPYLEIKMIESYGPLKIKDNLKKYYIIIISSLLSLLIVVLTSNLIVDVQVIHEKEDLQEIILNDLYELGIHKFSFKKTFKEIEKIKKEIKRNHLDRIEWIEITKSGMRYLIEVEERVQKNISQEKGYCHVIATKNGLIKRINVYDGQAVVEFNDYVKKGDILISGDVKLNDKVVSHNCAKGDVYAEVWYTVNVKVPLNYYEERITGKKRNNYIINFDGGDYKLLKDRLTYYQPIRKKIFDLLGIKIYKEMQKELKKVPKKYSEKEALNKGMVLAYDKISLKIKKGDYIVDEKILQNKLIDSTMDIDIFIIAEEYIGMIVEAKDDEINENDL